MLEKNDTIVIQRVANGFQVSPGRGPNNMVCLAEVVVFQQIGSALISDDKAKRYETLLAWLHDHFDEPVDKPKP